MCGKTTRNKIRNDNIRKGVGVTPIVEKMVENKSRWFGHVERRPVDFTRIIKCYLFNQGFTQFNNHHALNQQKNFDFDLFDTNHINSQINKITPNLELLENKISHNIMIEYLGLSPGIRFQSLHVLDYLLEIIFTSLTYYSPVPFYRPLSHFSHIFRKDCSN